MGEHWAVEELLRAIDEDLAAGQRRIRLHFWTCPDGHSSHRPGDPMPDGPTVVWHDGVAHCLSPGCDRTSADRGGSDAVAPNRPDPQTSVEGEDR